MLMSKPREFRSRFSTLEKPIWVSVPDACFAGGFGRTRCYELIANGLLVSIKLGRKRLISFASIEGLSNAP